MSYPNMAENQAKLEQFLQRTENKLKYGVSSYKCASTKSHLKSPPPPPEKAELKRASKRPTVVDFGVTKPLRDPKIELERQRHKENLKKYSPANLRAQAREKRNVEQAEQEEVNTEPEEDDEVAPQPAETLEFNGALDMLLSSAPKALMPAPKVLVPAPKALVPAAQTAKKAWKPQQKTLLDIVGRWNVSGKVRVAAPYAAALAVFVILCVADDLGAAAEWLGDVLLDTFTNVETVDFFEN